MRIEPAHWRDWQALRVSAGEAEMIVGVSAGPRILSLRHAGGPNLLQADATPFTVGAWQRHGGHRFTIAPEEDRSYEPDNAPCAFAAGGRELRISAPLRSDGTRLSLVVRAALDGTGFDLDHMIENRGTRPWRGAPWAITCVPPEHPAVAPHPGGPLHFWPDSAGPGWQRAPGHVALRPGAARGKIGWHSEAAWLASLQPAATLVIHAPEPPPAGACVDGGCNVEIYTSPACTELETLGGQTELAPGGRVTHAQRWRLLPPDFTPADCAAIGTAAGCMTNANSLSHSP